MGKGEGKREIDDKGEHGEERGMERGKKKTYGKRGNGEWMKNRKRESGR